MTLPDAHPLLPETHRALTEVASRQATVRSPKRPRPSRRTAGLALLATLASGTALAATTPWSPQLGRGDDRPHPATTSVPADQLAALNAQCSASRAKPRHSKLLLGAMIAYLALPFDLVSDFIPVAGQLDDAIIVALVLRTVLRPGGPDLLREHWPGPDPLAQRPAAHHLRTHSRPGSFVAPGEPSETCRRRSIPRRYGDDTMRSR